MSANSPAGAYGIGKDLWWFVSAAVFFAGLIAVPTIIVIPHSSTITRLYLVVSVPLLWAAAVILLRNRKRAALTVLFTGAVLLSFPFLPGRDYDTEIVEAAYLKSLTKYEGVPYVWGGENQIGIDCSGLVRRSLIDADLLVGIQTLNPRLIREAFFLWWNDCTAESLMHGYRCLTKPVLTASSINAVDQSAVRSGDLAVTADGIHVVAYLGDNLWIQADSDVDKVIKVVTPTSNRWFLRPVHMRRWTVFSDPEPSADCGGRP
ncbi:MAG: NlpC/P60 family protein [Pseudomonadota bacterium]